MQPYKHTCEFWISPILYEGVLYLQLILNDLPKIKCVALYILNFSAFVVIVVVCFSRCFLHPSLHSLHPDRQVDAGPRAV